MTPNPNPSPELIEAIWKQACVGREGYCSSDLQQAAKWAIGEAFRLATVAAQSAELPANYQWSEDNRSKFNFGRDTAVEAIATLPPPTPAETVTVALPGAGEVETNRRYLCELLRREGQHSGVWFADKLIEAAGLIEASAFIPTVTEDARAAFYAESSVAVQRKESDQVVTVEGFLRAIAKLNTSYLAPVAAVNDEGVAEAAIDVRKLVTDALYDHQLGNRAGIRDRLIADVSTALATSCSQHEGAE